MRRHVFILLLASLTIVSCKDSKGAEAVPTTGSGSSGSADLNALPKKKVRDPNLPNGEKSLNRWFDTSAFTLPDAFTFGNAG